MSEITLFTNAYFKIVTDGKQEALEIRAPFHLEGQNRKRVFMRRCMEAILKTEYEVWNLTDEAAEAEWKKIEQSLGKPVTMTPYYP